MRPKPGWLKESDFSESEIRIPRWMTELSEKNFIPFPGDAMLRQMAIER
jgi:hypothetical protein